MRVHGTILVHYPVFFRLHQVAQERKIVGLQNLLISSGMVHLVLARFSYARTFHDHLLTYIAARGAVGDLLSLVLTSTRTLQLLGETERVRRATALLEDFLVESKSVAPTDVVFFERDTGLLTWLHDRQGLLGQEISRWIGKATDIGALVRGVAGAGRGGLSLPNFGGSGSPIQDIGGNGFSLPDFGGGGKNPIQGIVDGLGVAGNSVDPLRAGSFGSSGGVKVKIDKKNKTASFDFSGFEKGPSSAAPPVQLTPVHSPLVDPRAPPDADPSINTQREFDQALKDVLGEPEPPPTKEEQDEMLATPAPEPSEPPPEHTTTEDIDEMLGDRPNPDDDGGPKGPASTPVPDGDIGPRGPAFYPQPEGGGPGGPAGRFYYPAPDGDGVNPRWRFFYPNPDDVGPGGPAGRSLSPSSALAKALRVAVSDQRYFPKSGSVFLPRLTETLANTGRSVELLGSSSNERISAMTFLLRIG